MTESIMIDRTVTSLTDALACVDAGVDTVDPLERDDVVSPDGVLAEWSKYDRLDPYDFSVLPLSQRDFRSLFDHDGLDGTE